MTPVYLNVWTHISHWFSSCEMFSPVKLPVRKHLNKASILIFWHWDRLFHFPDDLLRSSSGPTRGPWTPFCKPLVWRGDKQEYIHARSHSRARAWTHRFMYYCILGHWYICYNANKILFNSQALRVEWPLLNPNLQNRITIVRLLGSPCDFSEI